MTDTPQPKYHIRGIPGPMVDRFWPVAEAYIKRALDHTSGEFTPADLKMLCKDRVIQLWLISKDERIVAALTTEIVVYPQRKHCRIITLGGSKAVEWMHLLDEVICPWALEQGCVGLEAFVRKGFVPILSNYGFSPKYTAVIRELV